jgi:serine/threonine protein kinase
MAAVFRARDERLGRLVALKILVPALTADGAFRRRFIAESRAAAAVDNPYIIPVYEAGEAGGVLFIAMRFVMGGDLRRALEREGALAPGRAAGFVSPVASALDAAHRAGLVHRDVRLANILVDAGPGPARSRVPVGLRGEQGGHGVGEPDRDRAVPGHPGLLGAGADPGPRGGRAGRPVRAGLRGLRAADRLGAV